MGQFRRNLLFSLISGKKESNYLTIEALEDGLTVSFDNSGLSYSIDGGDWVELESYEESAPINKDQIISFKGEFEDYTQGVGQFTISKRCNLKGNCMSIIYGDNAYGQTSMKNNSFRDLFRFCATIEMVSENFLPATELTYGCYYMMFQCCTSLINAPKLPATTMESDCYGYMFHECTNLVNAPELPATTLADSCYIHMFEGCTSLVEAPDLPATQLSDWCYDCMFYGCTSLINPPKLPATTLKYGCYSYMFYGCENMISAPDLPAESLVSDCYERMFKDCYKLSYIKALFTTTPSSSYTDYWVHLVNNNGVFVKSKDATWNVTGVNGIPSGWKVITE